MSVIAVNLLPVDRFARMRRRGLMNRWRVAAVVYMTLLAVVWVVVQMSAVQENSDREELDKVQRDVAALRSTEQRISRQFAGMRKQLDAARAVGHHPDWGVLLALTAAERGPDILLQSCEVRTVRRAETVKESRGRQGKETAAETVTRLFLIQGSALSVRAVQEFVLRLEATGLFRRVQLGDAQAGGTGAQGEATTRFSI